MQPLITLITPVHQALATLGETAASVLSQQHSHFEWLLVVDDGDSARYQALPELHDARVRWLSSGGIARGPSCARNVGLEQARGDFIAHLDADDLMLPERLSTLLPLAQAHGAAVDNHAVFDGPSGHELGRCLPIGLAPLVHVEQVIAFELPFFPLYRPSLNLRWAEGVRFAEDVLFNVALVAANGALAVEPNALLRYRTHPHSLCNQMPQGFERARDGYALLLRGLADGSIPCADAQLMPQLLALFARKNALNEAFWKSYCAGECANFNEFATRRAAALQSSSASSPGNSTSV